MILQKHEAAERIEKALKTRTGKTWEVVTDHGQFKTWLTIQAPAERRVCHNPNPHFNVESRNEQPDIPPWFERTPKPGEAGIYTSLEDQAILEETLGICTGCLGISVNPISRNWFVSLAEKA